MKDIYLKGGIILGNKKIICNKCSGRIKSKYNLVTTYKFIKIVPYHSQCYSDDLKSLNTIFVSNKPINGAFSNISTIIITIIAFILIFLGYRESILLFLMPLARLYSLFMIENRL